MKNLYVLILLSMSIGACGVSKFKSVVESAGLNEASESSSSNQQPASHVSDDDSAQLDAKVVEEDKKRGTSDAEDLDDNTDEIAAISANVWVVSWNTDDYIDADCLMLTEGIAVTEKECGAEIDTVCETSCQASAKSPQECSQDKYVFQDLGTKLSYTDAQQACVDQGLVLLHYHISKVADFKAQAGI